MRLNLLQLPLLIIEIDLLLYASSGCARVAIAGELSHLSLLKLGVIVRVHAVAVSVLVETLGLALAGRGLHLDDDLTVSIPGGTWRHWNSSGNCFASEGGSSHADLLAESIRCDHSGEQLLRYHPPLGRSKRRLRHGRNLRIDHGRIGHLLKHAELLRAVARLLLLCKLLCNHWLLVGTLPHIDSKN